MVGQPMRFTARISRPSRRDLTVAVLNASGRPPWAPQARCSGPPHQVRRRFAAAVRDALPPSRPRCCPPWCSGHLGGPAETSRDFRAAGLTHLTAVSGANVTIVCAAVLFSARLIGPRAAVVFAALALVAFVSSCNRRPVCCGRP